MAKEANVGFCVFVIPTAAFMIRHPRAVFSPSSVGGGPAPADDSGWMITLSDLTLLLLCFLGLSYVKDYRKPDTVQVAQRTVEATREDVPSAQVQVGVTDSQATDWSTLQDEVTRFIADAAMGDDLTIEATPDEIVISLKDAIPFDSGKTDLKAGALPVIDKVAAIALDRPGLYLEVNGHTDDRPISTAEFPSNWELSTARASRVARFLIEKGVHPSRIGVHGFAYHRPRFSHDSLIGRSANRRVEIRLLRTAPSAADRDPASWSR